MSETTLIRSAEKWVRVGERSFWNWRLTLTADERRVVDRWMTSPDPITIGSRRRAAPAETEARP